MKETILKVYDRVFNEAKIFTIILMAILMVFGIVIIGIEGIGKGDFLIPFVGVVNVMTPLYGIMLGGVGATGMVKTGIETYVNRREGNGKNKRISKESDTKNIG